MAKTRKSENLQTGKNTDVKKQTYCRALDLFAEKGYNNVKISDICAKAGISVGTFYYYFPSKEAILLAYGDVADELAASIASGLKDLPPDVRLKELVKAKTAGIAQYGPEICAATTIACFKHHRDDTFDMHRAHYGHFMRCIEDGIRSGIFREDINLYSATSILRYLICGLAAHWAIQADSFDLESETERLAGQYIALLKPCSK